MFRHFPTKLDLLQAIMKDLARRLREEAAVLAGRDEPGSVLFEFCEPLVAQAAGRRQWSR